MNSGNEFGTENSVRMGDGGIVEAIVANHFEMFVRNMNNETHNKSIAGMVSTMSLLSSCLL